MGLFDHFPYTNVHELNLDWILSKMKALEAEWESFTSGNSLQFADPMIHDVTKTYAKNTIVLDGNGNAYVSLQAVPVGVGLQNRDYWLMVFDYEAFIEKVNKNFTARYYRGSYRATAAMAIGDWLTVDDVLYKATAAIAIDDILEDEVNITHFTLEDFIKAFMLSANQMIQQYKNDIDASELLYRQQLAQDISLTTSNLQAQLDAAIAGATVDSEVINARIGAYGETYATLGDAIRTQITMVSERTRNLIYGLIESASIESNGHIYTPSGSLNIYFAPVNSGDTYYISSGSGNIACAFFTSQPNATSISYDNSRVVQASHVVTAPITGFIAFQALKTYTTPQLDLGSSPTDYIPPVIAYDYTARKDINDLDSVSYKKTTFTDIGIYDLDNLTEFGSIYHGSGMTACSHVPAGEELTEAFVVNNFTDIGARKYQQYWSLQTDKLYYRNYNPNLSGFTEWKEIGYSNNVTISKEASDSYVISIGNYYTKFKHLTNVSLNMDEWNLVGVYYKDNTTVITTGTDITGPILEQSEPNFIGGLHGNEHVTDLAIFCDGSEWDYDTTTSCHELTIIMTAEVYRASDATHNYNKYLKLIFKNNTIRVENNYKCIVNDSVLEKAVNGGLIAIQNTILEQVMLNNYYSDVPPTAVVNIADHNNISGTMIWNKGSITVRNIKGQDKEHYSGYLTVFTDETPLRNKIYFDLYNGHRTQIDNGESVLGIFEIELQ